MRADALSLPFGPRSFDLVICSAFLHQLGPPDATRFLKALAPLVRDRLIVSDLVRSCLGDVAFGVFARLARFHPTSRHDGLISVRRAYRPKELASIVGAAGLVDWSLRHHPFCRMTMACGPQEVRDATEPCR